MPRRRLNPETTGILVPVVLTDRETEDETVRVPSGQSASKMRRPRTGCQVGEGTRVLREGSWGRAKCATIVCTPQDGTRPEHTEGV